MKTYAIIITIALLAQLTVHLITIKHYQSRIQDLSYSRDLWQSRFDAEAQYRLDHCRSNYNYLTKGE